MTVSAAPLAELRRDFPIFATRVHGKPLVYLDSAATRQKAGSRRQCSMPSSRTTPR